MALKWVSDYLNGKDEWVAFENGFDYQFSYIFVNVIVILVFYVTLIFRSQGKIDNGGVLINIAVCL